MKNIVVLVSGGGTNLQALIDAEKRGEIKGGKITCVISSKADAYALERAKQNGIPSVVISKRDHADSKEYGKAILDELNARKADLVVLAGYLVVIPERMIHTYRNRIINVHPSLIPSFCGTGYYGLKVHEGVLKRGVKVTGATVHFVDEGTDTGPIILQKAVNVKPDDTPEILQRRVMEQAEWQLLPKAIDLIANGRVRVEDNKVYLQEEEG